PTPDACACPALAPPLPAPYSYSAPLSSTPPPPRPTLFPYTTLFRSRRYAAQRVQQRQRPGDLLRRGEPEPAGRRHPVRRQRPGQDRKSTRLNSSHVSISYAVFCLKKKSMTVR